MAGEESAEYVRVITAEFSGPMEAGQRLVEGLEGFVLLPSRDGAVDAGLWRIQRRISDWKRCELVGDLTAVLQRERKSLARFSVTCERVVASIYSELGMAAADFAPAEMLVLGRMDVPVVMEMSVKENDDFHERARPVQTWDSGYNCVVGLDIYGFEGDPAALTARLDMEPTVTWRADDLDVRGKVREKNRWYSDFESDELEPGEFISDYVRELRGKLPVLDEMGLREFAEVRVGVFQEYPESDSSAVELRPEVLTAVGEAGLRLSVSMYFTREAGYE